MNKVIRSIIPGPCTDPEYSKLTHFEVVFGYPTPAGICKPSTPGLDEHFGDLSEQINTITNHLQ